jgi:SAM-dependent methyltransferase
MSQDTIFQQGEADCYFERNQKALAVDGLAERDPILHMLADAGLRPTGALEVGAANGYRLEALRRQTGCRAVAVEPSGAAVANGKRQFPEVRFIQALGHELEGFATGEFDLVIASFVLHWVDRARLFATAAALDRVLADGGRLVISDFLPDRPQRVPYHHRPDAEVWTYKQDYAAFWAASAVYKIEDRRVYDYRTRQASDAAPPEQRFAVTLLRKNLSGYVSASLPAVQPQGNP